MELRVTRCDERARITKKRHQTAGFGVEIKVLVVQGAFEEMYEPAWCRALEENGVETALFRSHAYTLPGVLGRVERRVLAGPGVHRIRSALLRQVRCMKPAVTLLYQGHYFDIDTVRELGTLTFVTGYHNDDPFGIKRRSLRYRHLHPALPAYRGFHAYREVNAAELKAVGVPNVKVLLPYFRPWIDYPRTLSRDEWAKWSCDLCFAGHLEPDERIGYLSQVARSGLNLRLYTQAVHARRILPPDVWSRVGPTQVALGDDYRKALCGSRIALSFYSRWNRDQYTRRSFEIPACGVFLLSERTEAMAAFFAEGVEAEYFSTADELLDKARYYLKHDAERRAIAQRGHDKVRRAGHDIYNRMKQWLADVAIWRS
jgi:spore maturation protein CgeB